MPTFAPTIAAAFPPTTRVFLRELATHNDRAGFAANRLTEPGELAEDGSALAAACTRHWAAAPLHRWLVDHLQDIEGEAGRR